MTSDVYLASKIHNWDVTDIQNEFAANSSFCGLNDLGGLNSLGATVVWNALSASEMLSDQVTPM